LPKIFIYHNNMRIVNINHKGGVGKTTNTIHIGAELHNRGYKVLLIDADNQCDLTGGVGIKNSSYTIKDFLDNKGKNVRLSSIAKDFHLLAGSPELYADKYHRQELQKSLENSHFDDLYDFILIDCPPTGINPHFVTSAELAICAVDYVIIPIQADLYSIKNVFPFSKKMLDLKKFNNRLKLLGIYFSNAIDNTNVFSNCFNKLKEENPNYVFATYIRKDVKVVEAALEGMTIFEYNDKCRAAEDFKSLVTEILTKIENGKN